MNAGKVIYVSDSIIINNSGAILLGAVGALSSVTRHQLPSAKHRSYLTQLSAGTSIQKT